MLTMFSFVFKLFLGWEFIVNFCPLLLGNIVSFYTVYTIDDVIHMPTGNMVIKILRLRINIIICYIIINDGVTIIRQCL